MGEPRAAPSAEITFPLSLELKSSWIARKTRVADECHDLAGKLRLYKPACGGRRGRYAHRKVREPQEINVQRIEGLLPSIKPSAACQGWI